MLCLYKVIVLLALLVPSLAFAENSHIVVVPQCLSEHLSQYQQLATINSFLLLEINDKGIDELIAAKEHQTTICGGFTDVTAEWEEFNADKNLKPDPKLFLQNTLFQQPLTRKKRTYTIHYEKETNQIIKDLNPQHMWANLTTFSSFPNRSARTDDGLKAAQWLVDQVNGLIKSTHREDVTVYTINTGRYPQPSVVTKIGQSNEPGIVISAHMDTLSSTFEKKPGADDDGTGSVTVLELGRLLLNSGMQFKKPIYLIWYAAEELGLVGSNYVVAEFKKQNIPVDAVLHFDMTGFTYKNDPTMWLMQDYVNKDLTSFLATLIQTYVKQRIDYTRCGYACSDHATWTRYGYKSSIAAEAKFEHTNPSMHTAQDTMDKLSLQHMTDYAKLAIAFAVELAEPV